VGTTAFVGAVALTGIVYVPEVVDVSGIVAVSGAVNLAVGLIAIAAAWSRLADIGYGKHSGRIFVSTHPKCG